MSYSPVYISHPATSITLSWRGSFCNHLYVHHNYPHLMLQTLDRSDPCQHNEQNHQTRGIPSVEQLQSWIESNKETNIDHRHHDFCILKITINEIWTKLFLPDSNRIIILHCHTFQTWIIFNSKLRQFYILQFCWPISWHFFTNIINTLKKLENKFKWWWKYDNLSYCIIEFVCIQIISISKHLQWMILW